MKIKKIKIKNFYSFKDVSLNLGKYTGLTLIKGLNKDAEGSNGSGKSALVEAVYFGITGRTIRKSTEAALIYNKAKKGCSVELTLDNDIVIKRSKKPTKLELFIKKENVTEASMALTQAKIDKLLNTNAKVLMASMFFGQSNDLNFLDATAEDKRVIIRNFLNLDDIFSMRDRIKSHKSTFYQTAKVNFHIVTEHAATIKSLEDKLKDMDHDFIFKSDAWDEQDILLEDILDAEQQVRTHARLLDNLKYDLNKVTAEIRRLRGKIEDVTEVCHSCEQPLPKSSIAKQRENLFEELENLEISETRINDSIGELNLNEPIPPSVTSEEYTQYSKWQQQQSKRNTYESLIKETNVKIGDADITRQSNEKMYEVMRFWERAFSEQGVIKYIISNILEYFNKQCNYYLGYLTNSKFFVEFDQELNEKIVSVDTLIPYISLSGGEKRKVNLSVLLALKDLLILTDKNQSDLLFFDEIAENLDEQGIIGLYQLLIELKKSKNIFVITHNKYLKTLLDSSKRILVIKENGISTIKGISRGNRKTG